MLMIKPNIAVDATGFTFKLTLQDAVATLITIVSGSTTALEIGTIFIFLVWSSF
jgi:hypothetical protein